MKNIWIVLIVAIVIIIIAYFIFKSKIQEAQKPKSWWENLGINIKIPGFEGGVGWFG